MSYAGFVEENTVLSSTSVQARLYGFPVNEARLGTVHRAWLDDFVIPIIAAGGSASIVGTASRTGSASQNLALSRRRSRATQLYIGQNSRGPVRCSDFTGTPRGIVGSGTGEQEAADSGQDDGYEDELYRAVVVRASATNLVEPPSPSDPPSMTTRRIISRTWSDSVTSSPRTGSPYRSGDGGAALAELMRDIYTTRQRGGTDRREYAEFPKTWAVNRVTENYRINNNHASPTGNTILTNREILYEWGPRVPSVQLYKTTTEIDRNGRRQTRTSTQSYPRDQVWRHVSAPDAVVF